LIHKNLTALLLLILSACLPIGGALFLAHYQAKDHEIRYLATLSAEVARRAGETRSQVVGAFEELKKDKIECDSPGLAKMQGIAINSTYLQGVGVYQDGNIVCSSFGTLGHAISLGEAQIRTATGIQVWADLKLPFTDKQTFNVFERDGYIAIVHPGQIIDITAREDVSLAVMISSPKLMFRSKGFIQPEWIHSYQPNSTETVEAGPYLVSYHAVPNHSITGVAASNLSSVWAHFIEFAKFLLPIGLVASLLLFLGTVMLLKRQASLKTRLITAIKNKELFLLYQPIFNIQNNQCIGAEALLRWKHQDGSADEPLLFIPAIEKHGLMQMVTQFVMHEAAHDMQPLLKQHPSFRLSINFSPTDLEDAGAALEIPRMIKTMGSSPRNLVIEVTERSVLDTEKTRRIIEEIRQSGVSIFIDDFGTGYSNLATLQSIHLDGLKMDRIFTESIDTTSPTQTVARLIIQLAQDLNLNLIAEGVESQSQLDYLRAQGVKYAQGFLLGVPMTADALKSMLDGQQ